jgi:hypothetical protein
MLTKAALAFAAPALALCTSCQSATSPRPCLGSTAAFSPGIPDFVATVSRITVERGWTPAGFYEVQYNLWLTRPPAAQANVGVILSDTTPAPTPVFARANGAITSSFVCAIQLGDTVDVWHTANWALGAAQAPPGDTAFEARQLLIHR